MLRIVLQRVHIGAACNVGGPVTTSVLTFDAELPEVEMVLRNEDQWNGVHVVGIEVLEAAKAGGCDDTSR